MSLDYWRLTVKRRENLAKVCLTLLTADVGGLVIPFFALPGAGFNASLFAGGFTAGIVLVFLIYAIER